MLLSLGWPVLLGAGLASSPLAGYVTIVAVCELTGECP